MPFVDRIEGTAPDGSEAQVDVSRGRRVIYLMTSSCKPCLSVWSTLQAGDVAVTPSPATESRRKIATLAPPGAVVVMSTETWFALRPGPAPWRVTLVDGEIVESVSAVSGEAGPQGVDRADYR